MNNTDRKGAQRRHDNDLELPPELEQQLREAAREAAGKRLDASQGSPLARLIGRFMEHALAEELTQHLGYEPREPQEPDSTQESPRRSNTRNGYSRKTLKTSLGATELSVPRDRDGSFEPQIVPKHSRTTQQVEERVLAMYAGGMTTRDIAEHVRELYHFEASEDFVSNIVMRVEPELKAWRGRSLEPLYAIVYIDAIHVKVRHSNGVKATACYIASGYGEDGTHEVLGVWIAPSEHTVGHGESSSFWFTALNELRSRGVDDILIIASDSLKGLDDAISAAYPLAQHIPCVVHQIRISLKSVGDKLKKQVAADLKPIYTATTYDQAEQALEDLDAKWTQRYPAIVSQWRQLLPTLAPLWSYSKELRKMCYTTNPQENINRQVRKVTKNRGVLPTIDSALRLLTLALVNIDKRAQRRSRPDWCRIVAELHITFAGRLPSDWGLRFN